MSCELVQTSLRDDPHFLAWPRSLKFLNKLQQIPSLHNTRYKTIAKDTDITGTLKIVHQHFQEIPSIDYNSSSDEDEDETEQVCSSAPPPPVPSIRVIY